VLGGCFLWPSANGALSVALGMGGFALGASNQRFKNKQNHSSEIQAKIWRLTSLTKNICRMHGFVSLNRSIFGVAFLCLLLYLF
jgi:hypothetical protein